MEPQRAVKRRNLRGAEHGQNTGDQRDVDSCGGGAVGEGEVVVVVEEELGDEEVGAVVHLEPGVLEVALEAHGLGVALGVTGGGDAEVVVGMDVANEVGGVAEAPLSSHEVLLAAGRVAAKGDDVLDARFFEALQDAVELIDGLADAGEVGHDLHARRLLGFDGNLLGEMTGGPARARK